MRYIPDAKYSGYPCSYVGTGCAYEDQTGKEFDQPLPEALRSDGYLSLDAENKYIRSVLPVKKKQYFKRGERPILKAWLAQNKYPCCICVYGHFIYAKGEDYWSFFDNDDDEIVCIWYLKESA